MKTTTKLVKKESVADGTVAFYFEKPQGFEFKAGQTWDITLNNPAETDKEGNSRTFSIVTAPADELLGFATRMRDTAFKRNMKNMDPGTEVEIEGPFGSFTLHNDTAKAAVFLVGGIGITPFHSMVKHAALNHLPHKIFLFYSNRQPKDAAFLQELTELENQNPNYKLIATMTEKEKLQDWSGETGYITKEMIAKYVPDMANVIYYIAGPATMVSAMHKMLNDAGINDDNIRIEEFAGY